MSERRSSDLRFFLPAADNVEHSISDNGLNNASASFMDIFLAPMLTVWPYGGRESLRQV